MSTLNSKVRMNDNETYFDAGYKAGQAMKHQDHALYNFQREWFRRAQLVCGEGERVEAREAWDTGYKIGRGPV